MGHVSSSSATAGNAFMTRSYFVRRNPYFGFPISIRCLSCRRPVISGRAEDSFVPAPIGAGTCHTDRFRCTDPICDAPRAPGFRYFLRSIFFSGTIDRYIGIGPIGGTARQQTFLVRHNDADFAFHFQAFLQPCLE